MQALMREVILSYGLLFGDHRSSRTMYRKTERAWVVVGKEKQHYGPSGMRIVRSEQHPYSHSGKWCENHAMAASHASQSSDSAALP